MISFEQIEEYAERHTRSLSVGQLICWLCSKITFDLQSPDFSRKVVLGLDQSDA
jgi:hypothetical protein